MHPYRRDQIQNNEFQSLYNNLILLNKVKVTQEQIEDFKKKLLKLTNLIIDSPKTPFNETSEDIIIVNKKTEYYWINIEVTACIGVNFDTFEECLTISNIDVDIESIDLNPEKYQIFHHPRVYGIKEKIERVVQHDNGNFNNIIESVIDEKIIELG